MMSENLQRKDCKATESVPLISYAVDSLVRMLAWRENGKDSQTKKENAHDLDCGLNMHELLAKLSPNGLWLKMYGDYCQSLLWDEQGEDSELLCQTWPKWGMMRHGVVTELRMSAHHTREKGCLLWRTPDANAGNRGPKSKALYEKCQKTRKHTITLNDQVKNWPTPSVCMAKGASGAIIRKDGKNRRNDRLDYAVYTGAGQLNPDWVESLMGLPMGWTDMDCNTPTPWQGWPAPINLLQCDYEPPRVTTGSNNRAKRLKALGNGCVPQQIYPIFKAIAELEVTKCTI